MVAIRGAITVDSNTKEDILKETETLLKEMVNRNNIDNDQIISIIFSATKDVTKVYPAVAARNLNITDAGLLCFQELNIENSLEKCIRILMHVNLDIPQKEVKHIYLKEATKLRPDIHN